MLGKMLVLHPRDDRKSFVADFIRTTSLASRRSSRPPTKSSYRTNAPPVAMPRNAARTVTRADLQRVSVCISTIRRRAVALARSITFSAHCSEFYVSTSRVYVLLVKILLSTSNSRMYHASFIFLFSIDWTSLHTCV